MATYATKTCNQCGVRKPQPEMKQTEMYVETGKSKTGISAATIVGIIFRNKKSGKSFLSWLFNSGQRSYTRKKTVWLCNTCADNVPAGNVPVGNFGKWVLNIMCLVAIIAIVVLVMPA
jgi:hypothetical protein